MTRAITPLMIRSARSTTSFAVGFAPVPFPGSRSTPRSTGTRTSFSQVSTAVLGMSLACSSVLHGVDLACGRLGPSRLLLQSDLLLSPGKALALGTLLEAVGRRHLSVTLPLRGGLLALGLRLRGAFGLLTVALDLPLALLLGHLVAQALALELRLGLLPLELGLALALPRLTRALGSLCARVGRRLLKAPLTSQIVIAKGSSRGLLGLTDGFPPRRRWCVQSSLGQSTFQLLGNMGQCGPARPVRHLMHAQVAGGW